MLSHGGVSRREKGLNWVNGSGKCGLSARTRHHWAGRLEVPKIYPTECVGLGAEERDTVCDQMERPKTLNYNCGLLAIRLQLQIQHGIDGKLKILQVGNDLQNGFRFPILHEVIFGDHSTHQKANSSK